MYDTYYLDNDLDLTGVDWTPIGTFYSRFNSIFTGWDEANKKEAVRKITGLTTNEGSDRQGLFAFNEGTIKNLIFDSCNVSGENYVGCVAAENSGTIQNITVTGSRVTGTVRDTGGVVGNNNSNGKINNVTVEFKNGKYYAVVNVESTHKQLPEAKVAVGIDMGLKTFATLSNGLKIANLDVTYEDEMIKKYQRSLSRKKA